MLRTTVKGGITRLGRPDPFRMQMRQACSGAAMATRVCHGEHSQSTSVLVPRDQEPAFFR